jgi:hypothetical protein
MEEAIYGAVCPGTFLEVAHDSRQVLTLEAQKLLTFHVIYQHPEDATGSSGGGVRGKKFA